MVIRDTPDFHAGPLAFVEHFQQHVLFDFQGDMQIEIMLILELKGHVRHLEKGQEGTVVQAKEGVQGRGLPARMGLADFQRARQWHAQEFLIEFSGFF